MPTGNWRRRGAGSSSVTGTRTGAVEYHDAANNDDDVDDVDDDEEEEEGDEDVSINCRSKPRRRAISPGLRNRSGESSSAAEADDVSSPRAQDMAGWISTARRWGSSERSRLDDVAASSSHAES